MDISSNFKITNAGQINTQKTSSKAPNLAPLKKDTFCAEKKKEENTESAIFNEILLGNFEHAKSLFMSKNPEATEKDFENFHKKCLFEYGSTPEILASGKDLDFDKVVTDESERCSRFYKNGVLLRETPIVHSPKDYMSPNFFVMDYMGHDEESKSYIRVGRMFGDGEFIGTETTFFEDRYNLKYKTVYNFINNEGILKYSADIDERALELRDKIDKTIPKYTESQTLQKPDQNTRLPKYLYHITTKENFEKMKQKGRIDMSSSDSLKGVYCLDADNFKQQWGEHEAWKGNLKEDLIFNQVAGKKGSSDIVVLQIPTKGLNKDKIRTRTEEDYFYSSEITYRGSLIGAKEPKCVAEGYDWATGIKNFQDNKSLEFIIQEPIDLQGTKVVYSGLAKKDNMEEIIASMDGQTNYVKSLVLQILMNRKINLIIL